jgi:predicted DNA binding CopG/RHH family protein
MRFEFHNKAARVNMRLPEPLLEAVKRRAASRGIPYQRFIREALEDAVAAKAAHRGR